MVALGLLNADNADMSAKTKIATRYSERIEESDLPKETKLIMDCIFKDCATIYKNILSAGASHNIEPTVCARKLLKMKKQEATSILIVGGDDLFETSTTFNALARHCSKVYLTNPNKTALEEQYNQLEVLLKHKKYPITIEKIDASAVDTDFLSEIKHILVRGSMGSYPEFEKRLIGHWRNITSHEISLVHLDGDKGKEQQTTGEWLNCLNLKGFIDRQQIKALEIQHDSLSNKITKEARNACQNCAYTRSIGDGSRKVIESVLTLDPNEYAHRTSSQIANSK